MLEAGERRLRKASRVPMTPEELIMTVVTKTMATQQLTTRKCFLCARHL